MRHPALSVTLVFFAACLACVPALADEGSFSPGDGRVVLLPTAQIMEAGTQSVSNYELLTFHYSYGAAEDTQFSVLVTAPVAQIGVMPSIKHRFLNDEHLKLAVMAYGGGMIFYAGGSVMAFTAGVGIIADWCIDDECRKIVSFSAQPGVGMAYDRGSSHGDTSSQYGFSFYTGPGLTVEISERVKLVAEVAYAMMGNPSATTTTCTTPLPGGGAGQTCREERRTDTMGVLAVDYALRLHGTSFAADLGFARPVLVHTNGELQNVEEVMKYLPLGFPWLSFTYQW